MFLPPAEYPPAIMAEIDADLEAFAARAGIDIEPVDLSVPEQRRAVAKQCYLRRYRPGSDVHEAYVSWLQGSPYRPPQSHEQDPGADHSEDGRLIPQRPHRRRSIRDTVSKTLTTNAPPGARRPAAAPRRSGR